MNARIRVMGRAAAVVAVLCFGSWAAMSSSGGAQTQEKRCYVMVCTGSICVAQQIECPVTPPPPIAPSTPG